MYLCIAIILKGAFCNQIVKLSQNKTISVF